jgi:hypothetical protein
MKHSYSLFVFLGFCMEGGSSKVLDLDQSHGKPTESYRSEKEEDDAAALKRS